MTQSFLRIGRSTQGRSSGWAPGLLSGGRGDDHELGAGVGRRRGLRPDAAEALSALDRAVGGPGDGVATGAGGAAPDGGAGRVLI